MKKLSPTDYERIRAAATAVDQRTRAHFVLAVVPVSDKYILYPVAASAVLAIMVGGILALCWPHLPFREAFGLQAAVFVAANLLFEWMPVRLLLVPPRQKRWEAHELARREFATRILSNPAHRIGVMFFVSLGEHYVEVLAAPEVHAKIGEDAWQKITADFVALAKAGKIADGFVAGIDACGALLAGHYPVTSEIPASTL